MGYATIASFQTIVEVHVVMSVHLSMQLFYSSKIAAGFSFYTPLSNWNFKTF